MVGVLIDVRDPERFETGHLAGAVNVPSGESAREAHDAAEVEAVEGAGATRDRVILVCGEGNRSARTADALNSEHGFTNIASISEARSSGAISGIRSRER